MNKNILIVDDDMDILEALEFSLESVGYHVDIDPNGNYAENLHTGVKAYLPDLIILDVLLSGRDGRIICQKLKKQNDTKHIPIIIISARPDTKKSSLEMGADLFLAKPFDFNNLIKKIHQLIPN